MSSGSNKALQDDAMAARFETAADHTTLPIAELRKFSEEQSIRNFGKADDMFKVTTAEVPRSDYSIPVRIYQPGEGNQHSLLVYMHGGAWQVGSLDSHDPVCRRIACRAQALVVSVGYRLAPEHQYPAGLDDCYAALRWAQEHAESFGVQQRPLGVAGDSAGGNLAAALTLRALSDPSCPRVDYHILICPALKDIGKHLTGSRLRYKDEPTLTIQAARGAVASYLDHHERHLNDPQVFPLVAPSLCGSPPALILVAQRDIIHDDGVEYAQRLIAEGIEVHFKEYPTEHNYFLTAPTLYGSISADAYRTIGSFIRLHSQVAAQ